MTLTEELATLQADVREHKAQRARLRETIRRKMTRIGEITAALEAAGFKVTEAKQQHGRPGIPTRH